MGGTLRHREHLLRNRFRRDVLERVRIGDEHLRYAVKLRSGAGSGASALPRDEEADLSPDLVRRSHCSARGSLQAPFVKVSNNKNRHFQYARAVSN